MEKLILYTYYRSSCAFRVRIALNLKGIECEQRGVDLVKDGGQHLSDEYKKINPYNQVPAMVVMDSKGQKVTLIQSLAIIDYLDDMYPEPSLVPKDPLEKAKVRAIAECITSGIQPLQNMPILGEVAKWGGKKDEWAKNIISNRFQALELMLEQSVGKCCFGDNITLADVCLVPQVYNARRYGVDMTLFPTISRICSHLEQLEAFSKAHPREQPDCPPQLKAVV
jgi:maleylacetoacetate isomerase